jgi:hypothetical protein
MDGNQINMSPEDSLTMWVMLRFVLTATTGGGVKLGGLTANACNCELVKGK